MYVGKYLSKHYAYVCICLSVCMHIHAYTQNVIPGNMSFKYMEVMIDVKEQIWLMNEIFVTVT